MTRSLSESAIVRDLAKRVCRQVTRRTIAALQKLNVDLLSGDDSGLVNIWDEICVQIQYEGSWAWDAYEETIRRIVTAQVEKLSAHEREAVWLQTPPAKTGTAKTSPIVKHFPSLAMISSNTC